MSIAQCLKSAKLRGVAIPLRPRGGFPELVNGASVCKVIGEEREQETKLVGSLDRFILGSPIYFRKGYQGFIDQLFVGESRHFQSISTIAKGWWP